MRGQMCSPKWFVVAFGFVLLGSLLPTGILQAAGEPNPRPIAVLQQLDIDNDSVPDVAPDSDGDGLPDNWEVGGVEGASRNADFRGDRYVSFPAPRAIGPGTPPVFVFNRQATQTSATRWDTDNDGLSDFIEVFGLKYIDDNNNGRLDFLFTDLNRNGRWDGYEPYIDLNGNGRYDTGEPYYDLNKDHAWTASAAGSDNEPIDPRSEWLDINVDGLPSIGERPLPNWFAVIAADQGAQKTLLLVDTNGDGMPDTVLEQVDNPASPFRKVGVIVDASGDGIPDALDLNGDGAADAEYDGQGQGDKLLSIRVFDWDGFLFTNPAVADTDLDGVKDGDDVDPLINPETFGVSSSTGFYRLETRGTADRDLDNDGLGNGGDLGNDYRWFKLANGTSYLGGVDNPTDIGEIVTLFRPDRVYTDPEKKNLCTNPTLPESLVDDLLGADWNGDGLFQITDVRNFHEGIRQDLVDQLLKQVADKQPICSGELVAPQQYIDFDEYFKAGDRQLYADDPQMTSACPSVTKTNSSCVEPTTPYGSRDRRLGWQEFLLPSAPSQLFMPDIRVWTILYAWRTPGFDIDGNGFVGTPEGNFAIDDLHPYIAGGTSGTGSGQQTIDGRIEVDTSQLCGSIGTATMTATVALAAVAMIAVPRFRRPKA